MKTALFLCAVSITLSSVFSLHSSNQDIYVESKINLACVREKGSHKSEKSIQLSLQAIQSNFLGADQTTDGNNGLPIVGLTIPIEINVTPRQQKSKMVLDIDAFVFTLTEKGFLISQTVLPQEFAPTSARWIDFDAGNGVVGHVFRDGSIRFSGPENEPLNPGTYLIPPSKVAFSQVRFPTKAKGFFSDDSGQLVRKKNFSISQGLSNLAGFVNGGFNYAEYYGLTFREGNILTVTTDNSFDNSQVPIAVFNKLNNQGEHLISQVNVVPPGYARSVLGEESLSSNPTNPNQLATTILGNHRPPSTLPGGFLGISNDGGLTWNSVDPFINLQPLPAPPGYRPVSTGDAYCIFDAFGNLFFVNLFIAENPSGPVPRTAFAYTVMSSDGGNTWTLIDLITGINPQAIGLDYPLLATGKGPDGSQVTWLLLKQTVSLAEIRAYGSTLPLIAAAYKTSGLGIFDDKRQMELPGTENGGFGGISVGPKGEVLVTGMSANNTLGSLPYTNATIWYSLNRRGFNGSFDPIKIAANSNTGYAVAYLPQDQRRTWCQPRAVIDRKGRWYLSYVDQPTPHVNQPDPNIFLIYSDDKGRNWSTPIRLNNDTSNTTFQFMPELDVDNKTNDLVVTWLDSREDELDTSTRLWGTVIKDGSLPVMKKRKRK